ncbi:MAG: AAA family ATPase [bacterium]|nr:AAA family ATPase [bacterium]
MTQDTAFSICKTGVNVFLTGEPGSGKTHTINRYVEYLRSHGIEPAITASTGIAATHIGGMTIHSWSGIGIKEMLSSADLGRIASKSYISKRINKTSVLIIDEISMLSENTLTMVDLVCKRVRENEQPFGGLQIILVGDFFQLPPISHGGGTNHFAFESESWADLDPTICYITEQHRQDDKEFLSVLNALRSGNFDEEHLCHIQKRMDQHLENSLEITKLFSHNIDVDRINSAELEKISSEEASFQMAQVGPRQLVAAIKKGCISPEEFSVKVGAVVMFTKNNPKAGFVNGTLGKIVGFDDDSGYPVVKTMDGRHIEAEPMDWTIEENGMIRAKVTQIPLRLAWAITIHKSQGMSLDAAIMDLSGVFEYGQGYVALSRVRRLSGLYLLGCNDHALLVHPDILEKDQEFRASSDKAEDCFVGISSKDLQKKYDVFITACGGNLKESKYQKGVYKKPHGSTYDETLALFQSGKSIKEIAEKRNITEGTVLSHIENLVSLDKIKRSDAVRIIEPPLKRVLPTIHKVFYELDTDRLGPVHEKLKGKYSYNDLRLARMVMK